MSTEFNPIKALGEEIAGLLEITKVLTIRRRKAEEAMAQAESELDAVLKLEGFANGEIARKQKVLDDLTEQQKARSD